MIITNWRLFHKIKLILYLNSFFSSDLICERQLFPRVKLSGWSIIWFKNRIYFCGYSGCFIVVWIKTWILKNFCCLYIILRTSSLICYWNICYFLLYILGFSTYHIQYLICFFSSIHVFFIKVILLFVLTFHFLHLIL